MEARTVRGSPRSPRPLKDLPRDKGRLRGHREGDDHLGYGHTRRQAMSRNRRGMAGPVQAHEVAVEEAHK